MQNIENTKDSLKQSDPDLELARKEVLAAEIHNAKHQPKLSGAQAHTAPFDANDAQRDISEMRNKVANGRFNRRAS